MVHERKHPPTNVLWDVARKETNEQRKIRHRGLIPTLKNFFVDCALEEVDRKPTEVDDRTSGSQEVHA